MSAVPRVTIVVSCASRKAGSEEHQVRLRELPEGERRVESWIARLASTESPRIPAQELYQGEHWQVAKGFPHTKGGRGADYWVLSAGYGLVRWRAELASYSATFSPGHPDSVIPRNGDAVPEVAQAWWDGLSRWRGPTPGAPRSLKELCRETATLIVVASPQYLRACEADLSEAAVKLTDRERLIVVSIGANRSGRFPNVLPGDARLQHMLRGTRGSLNARVAQLLLERLPPEELTYSRARRLVQRSVAQQPPIKAFDRRAQTDEEVKAFIRARRDANSSASSLLRQLRDEGLACEQGRFRRLYLEEEVYVQ